MYVCIHICKYACIFGWTVCLYRVAKTHTFLIFIGHFPHKSPISSGSFAKNELRLKASCGSALPFISIFMFLKITFGIRIYTVRSYWMDVEMESKCRLCICGLHAYTVYIWTPFFRGCVWCVYLYIHYICTLHILTACVLCLYLDSTVYICTPNIHCVYMDSTVCIWTACVHCVYLDSTVYIWTLSPDQVWTYHCMNVCMYVY